MKKTYNYYKKNTELLLKMEKLLNLENMEINEKIKWSEECNKLKRKKQQFIIKLKISIFYFFNSTSWMFLHN